MAFTYTVSKPNFNDKSLLPGTALNYRAGSVATGDFKEGNGIVVMCTPLVLEIDLFELHTLTFQRISIPVDDFIKNKVTLQVLTIEDGIGNEPTGAIPTDIYPPEPVNNLRAEYTDTTVSLYWDNPLDDVDHVKVLLNDTVEHDNITGTTVVQTMLQPDTTYRFAVIVVDAAGNESESRNIEVTMNAVGDTTINLAIA
ncbi:fibronectin type III domain-containing protein [Solibacillus silvestris]